MEARGGGPPGRRALAPRLLRGGAPRPREEDDGHGGDHGPVHHADPSLPGRGARYHLPAPRELVVVPRVRARRALQAEADDRAQPPDPTRGGGGGGGSMAAGENPRPRLPRPRVRRGPDETLHGRRSRVSAKPRSPL